MRNEEQGAGEGPLTSLLFSPGQVPAVPYKNPNNYVRYSGRLAEEIAKVGGVADVVDGSDVLLCSRF